MTLVVKGGKAVRHDDHLEVGQPEASSSRVSNRLRSPLPRRRRVERSRSRTPVRRRHPWHWEW